MESTDISLANNKTVKINDNISEWPVNVLAPEAMLNPDRIDICTIYQMHKIDKPEWESHLGAAIAHIQQAKYIIEGISGFDYGQLRKLKSHLQASINDLV